jgi:hypothetical protein
MIVRRIIMLCALCASVVNNRFHHRGTENTENYFVLRNSTNVISGVTPSRQGSSQ